VAHLFAEFDLLAVRVVDASGRMQGIITIDDIVDVVTEEASKDLQKFGGSEALHSAYMDTGLWEMIKMRAGWLAVLFVGEMLTATAMAYEDQLARAVVLAVFVPLSSAEGGTLDLRPRLSSSAP
jgi:magnesium transporter